MLPRVLVARAVHYSKLVSLRNRTEEENGKTPVCKKPDRAITTGSPSALFVGSGFRGHLVGNTRIISVLSDAK